MFTNCVTWKSLEEGASKRCSEAHSHADRFPARWRKDVVNQCMEVPESVAWGVTRSRDTTLYAVVSLLGVAPRASLSDTFLQRKDVVNQCLDCYPKPQTSSTGLRHLSFKEGAGKRCSECAQASQSFPGGLRPGSSPGGNVSLTQAGTEVILRSWCRRAYWGCT